ncbi:hypothetical protein RHECNPAF_17000100 [Rhizobium etli CNPAF512]|nr:hypothetical protein RHECNPAF_17000100 [Rhizobium etli CNPAF512]
MSVQPWVRRTPFQRCSASRFRRTTKSRSTAGGGSFIGPPPGSSFRNHRALLRNPTKRSAACRR